MAKPPINSNKVLVFTGAGISAESGIETYRDADGAWNKINPKRSLQNKHGRKILSKYYHFLTPGNLAFRKPNPTKHTKRLSDLKKNLK